MIHLLVKGATGKMGTRIIALARQNKNFSVVDSIEKADVVVDFSHSDVTLKQLEEAATAQKPVVIGTTGHTPDQLEKIRTCSKKIPIVFSPNMSVAVNVMWKLLSVAARALGPAFGTSISETHHIHKKDKPSGTALQIVKVLAEALKVSPEKIPVESIRKGEVVGDHTTLFTGPQETLSISHHAVSRDIFASGALRAAEWVIGKPSGLWSMWDVLGL